MKTRFQWEPFRRFLEGDDGASVGGGDDGGAGGDSYDGGDGDDGGGSAAPAPSLDPAKYAEYEKFHQEVTGKYGDLNRLGQVHNIYAGLDSRFRQPGGGALRDAVEAIIRDGRLPEQQQRSQQAQMNQGQGAQREGQEEKHAYFPDDPRGLLRDQTWDQWYDDPGKLAVAQLSDPRVKNAVMQIVQEAMGGDPRIAELRESDETRYLNETYADALGKMPPEAMEFFRNQPKRNFEEKEQAAKNALAFAAAIEQARGQAGQPQPGAGGGKPAGNPAAAALAAKRAADKRAAGTTGGGGGGGRPKGKSFAEKYMTVEQ